MGESLPQSAYCRREIVDEAGARAADIFAACRSDGAQRTPTTGATH